MRIDLFRPVLRVGQSREDHNRMLEQVDYLEGVLWADKGRRLDPQSNPDDIDKYGTASAAFWRGLIEAGGYVAMLAHGDVRRYPRVELRATYGILDKFLDFMQEETRPTLSQVIAGGTMYQAQWDEDGKLHQMAAAGLIRVTGRKAQDIVKVLYPPESRVGLESIRAVVDEIIAWVPRA